MNGFITKVPTTDGQARNGTGSVRQPSGRRTKALKLTLFSATLLAGIAPFAAQSADDVQLPVGYRNWFHVNTMIIDKPSPLFESLGGMHNVHVNAAGEEALKKGGPYPDGTVFVTDLHDFSISEGITTEGALKGVAVMVKDQKKFAATGGWGFQVFIGGDAKKTLVTDPAKQCFSCHQPQKDHDYVYSTYIP
jgi:hypothetical protein